MKKQRLGTTGRRTAGTALLATTALVAITPAAVGAAAKAPTVRAIRIMSPGTEEVTLSKVNSRGEVLGQTRDITDTGSSIFRSFVWREGRVTWLDGVDGLPAEAKTLNDRGLVVGSTTYSSTGPKATAWVDGKPRLVPGMVGASSVAYEVNKSGQMVVQDGIDWKFRKSDGTLATMTRPANMICCQRMGGYSGPGLNDAGQAIGSAIDSTYTGHALLWQDGVLNDIGTLSPLQGFGASTIPFSINAAGQIIGQGPTSEGQLMGFLWSNGSFRTLGSLGGSSARPIALNKNGLVVGRAYTASGQQQAAYWDASGAHALGTLGGDYSEALAVNDAGQIVGSSNNAAGAQHAVLWDHGRTIDLGIPTGAVQSSATLIDNDGLIVGTVGRNPTPTTTVTDVYRWTVSS